MLSCHTGHLSGAASHHQPYPKAQQCGGGAGTTDSKPTLLHMLGDLSLKQEDFICSILNFQMRVREDYYAKIHTNKVCFSLHNQGKYTDSARVGFQARGRIQGYTVLGNTEATLWRDTLSSLIIISFKNQQKAEIIQLF